MPADLEYDRAMRYWMPVLAVLLAAFFTLSASAQANGVPPSVTSFGFGGHPGFNGPPPSVNSLGPRGVVPARGSFHQPPFRPGMHHHQQQGYAYPYYVPYYVPYYPVMDPNDAEGADESLADPSEDPNQYQGGPTIFDRRGPGTRPPNDYPADKPRSAVPKPAGPVAAAPALFERPIATAPEPARAPEPVIAVQPPTILIFKDGHQQQVSNYAIVGTNLFDLTPGHRLKIALADLDLDATQKANDEQGIDFKLPELPNSN
ncbi:MAG: hypothetical protein WA628_27500 [Terriglobales bacterium]